MLRYGAVDIGSNSARMMAGGVLPDGGIEVAAQLRQVTRLGASVFQDGRISEQAIALLCETLARFANVLRQYAPAAVRAVATAAVRDATNQAEFVDRASAALGYPVEIVSGQEEARLIHLGVQSRWPHPNQRVFMIDVGGGSAEIIFANRGVLEQAFSKPLGAVRLTEVFLAGDPPTDLQLLQMNDFIEEKLGEPVHQIGGLPVDRVIATSATAAALVCGANNIPRERREEADRLPATIDQIRKLYNELSRATVAARRAMPGIGPRRAEIIIAGAAVFLHTLELFGLESLYYSTAGVRDGIIADLAARGSEGATTQLGADQLRTVEGMVRRYQVRSEHARKVASLARDLFLALQPLHKLGPQYCKLLEAAAYLHDVGHFVSDTAHHKHSHYLVLNSDLPGFTDKERAFIAVLCRYHRKSAPAARHPQFQELQPSERQPLLLLVPLLRLADSLDRGHAQRVDRIRVELRDGSVAIVVESREPADLELWAAGRIGEQFRAVYGAPLVLARS